MRWLRRLSGIADAGVSSVGNLALSVVAARSLPLETFGLMSTTLLIGLVALGVFRALLGDPLVLNFSDRTGRDHVAISERVIGAALLASLVSLAPLWLLTLGITRVAGASWSQASTLGAALALTMPLLALQDLLRSIAYSAARPLAAFPNSLAWTVALIATLVVLSLVRVELPAAGYILVWGASAGAGLVVGLILNRVRVRLAGARSWFREHRPLSRTLLQDFGLTQVTAEASMVFISMIAGAAEAGLIRKAQIPLAPIVIVTSGVIAIGQPYLVRMVASGSQRQRPSSFAYRLGGAAVLLALTLGLVVWLVPDRWMAEVAGEDWSQARPLVPILSVYLALGALAGCQGIALRVMGRIADQVRLRLWLSPLTLVLVCLTALAGARGAALGLALGVSLVVIAWACLLHSDTNALHRRSRRNGGRPA